LVDVTGFFVNQLRESESPYHPFREVVLVVLPPVLHALPSNTVVLVAKIFYYKTISYS